MITETHVTDPYKENLRSGAGPRSIARILVVSVAPALTAAVAVAQPPGVVFDFEVTSDTMDTYTNYHEKISSAKLPSDKLGTIVMVEHVLNTHKAQLSDLTNPMTDDKSIIMFTMPRDLPGNYGDMARYYLNISTSNPYCPVTYPDRLFQTLPECSYVDHQPIGGEGYTLDIKIASGGRLLSGTIDIADVQQHGYGCDIEMTGSNNSWKGTWSCVQAGSRYEVHTFTATSKRITTDENLLAQN
jgi:hypothetical protein